MKSFRLRIITPEKIVYEDDIEIISLRTESGQIQVFADHEHLISVIVPGELIVTKGGEEYPFVVGQGAISINANVVELLVTTTESVAEIDEARAQEALERAQAAMEEESFEYSEDYARLEALISRNLARLKTVKKHR